MSFYSHTKTSLAGLNLITGRSVPIPALHPREGVYFHFVIRQLVNFPVDSDGFAVLLHSTQGIAGLNSIWSEPGSSVSIVSGYGLDDRTIEVRSPAEAKGFFLKPLCPDRLWGPPSLLSNGSGGKARPGCDADHSLPSRAEVENE
jgi:hypothetical protein